MRENLRIDLHIFNQPDSRKLSNENCWLTSLIWRLRSKEFFSQGVRILFWHVKCGTRYFFVRNAALLFVENSRQISTCSSCQNLLKHLDSFDFFFYFFFSYWDGLEQILKRPFEMDQSLQSGYLVPTLPSFSLSLFYNLIKSALCFATFQALISGLGRVKRPRQFEKGSRRHKEAACSQSFPSSTPPRQKEGERGSKRVICWCNIVRT